MNEAERMSGVERMNEDLIHKQARKEDDLMLTKEERRTIEMRGIPYHTIIILRDWKVCIGDLELVLDKERQVKGIDYIVRTEEYTVYIDGKHHEKMHYFQHITDYGVDALSLEITKACGLPGWAINEDLKTDYIIDSIEGIGYYMIDAKALHPYLREHYEDYPIGYSNEGLEDYRVVSTKDLIEQEIILYFTPWEDLMQTRTYTD